MRTIGLIRDLLTASEQKKLLGLVPLMLIASILELALVSTAATFFHLLSNPDVLETEGRVRTAFLATGLDNGSFLIAFGLLLLSVVIAGNAFAAFANRSVYLATWQQVVDIGERTLGAYLYQPYEFFLSRSASDLAHRALQDVQQVVSKVIVAGTLVVVRSLSGVMITIFLVFQEPMLTFVLVVSVGSVYGSTFLVLKRWIRRLGKNALLANRARQRYALETLRGVKEVKLNGLERANLDRFRGPSVAFANNMAARQTVAIFTKYALEAAAIGGLVLVVVLFIWLGRSLQDILPVIATFAFAAFRLLPTFQLLFATASQLQAHAYALERVHHDLTTAPPPVEQAETALPFDDRIEVAELEYVYPEGPAPVIRGMNLEIRKGSWTALVGTTGAGKSTLVDLIVGLLQPRAGEIRVDGQALSTPRQVLGWQKGIGYVAQSMFVIDDSISRNIALGDPEPDLERVRGVAELASLAQFVEGELPEGYDTQVGDFGTRLSGGQRQRMAIARALYRSPQLLVLDEATSALDNRTEADVMAALRQNYSDTTVIMIAHRLTTTQHCDRILMLDQGRVVDEGSYDELYDRSDVFRKMVEAAKTAPEADAEDAPAK